MDPRNPPQFQQPLVEYELGPGAVEAVKAQLGTAVRIGHRVAQRLIDIVTKTPGRAVTLAPAGTPSDLLNEFEDGYAAHREFFAFYGHSPQWDEWIARRIAPLADPYVISLGLMRRRWPRSGGTPQRLWGEKGWPTATLLVDDELTAELALGDVARDPEIIRAVINMGDEIWAAVAFAGECRAQLPVEDLTDVSSDLLLEVVAGGGPRAVVVNPYQCNDGYLFWEPLGAAV